MKRSAAAVATFAALFTAATCLADVTVERFVKTSGLGGLGASESTSVAKISGLRKREATKIAMAGAIGGFARRVAGDLESDSITDVPRDRVVTIDHKRKGYSEASISQRSQRIAQTEQGRRERPQSDVKIVRNEVTVTETGEAKTISGFPCRLYRVVWLVETENMQTLERAVTTMTMDLWNTEETAATRALAEEEAAFTAAYLKAMGFDQSREDWNRFGMGMVSGLLGGDEASVRKELADLQRKMEKVKGFSIATEIRWEAASSNGSAPAPAEETSRDTKGAKGEATGTGEGVAASRGLGWLLGKAKRSPATQKGPALDARADAQGGREGGGVLFSSYTEIRSISAEPLPESDFQVPEDYTGAK